MGEELCTTSVSMGYFDISISMMLAAFVALWTSVLCFPEIVYKEVVTQVWMDSERQHVLEGYAADSPQFKELIDKLEEEKDSVNNPVNRAGERPVHVVSRLGDREKWSKLACLEEINLSLVDNAGNTALHCAKTEAMADALVNGALKIDPNVQNKAGETALMRAVLDDRPADLVEFLNAVTDRTLKDREGYTASHYHREKELDPKPEQ